jgi:hypothetical protein
MCSRVGSFDYLHFLFRGFGFMAFWRYPDGDFG